MLLDFRAIVSSALLHYCSYSCTIALLESSCKLLQAGILMQTLELVSSSRSTTRQEDETIWRAQDKLLKRFLCVVLQNSTKQINWNLTAAASATLLLSYTKLIQPNKLIEEKLLKLYKHYSQITQKYWCKQYSTQNLQTYKHYCNLIKLLE